MTVAFIPDRVRAYLTESGVTLGDSAGLTVVIVPLWRTPQGVSPFEEGALLGHRAWTEDFEQDTLPDKVGADRGKRVRSFAR